MATDRFRLVSVALYTSPISPTPIWVVISYRPEAGAGSEGQFVWIIRA